MKSGRLITAFSFLAVLAAPLLVLSFLQLKQAYIKHSIEERLEAGLQKTIFIPTAKLKRINSRELEVDGKLFDLKELTAVPGGYHATGVFDEEETAVLQHLEAASQAKNSKDTPLLAHLLQLLQEGYVQSHVETAPVAAITTELFQNPIASLPTVCQPVLAPPPQA